MIFPRITCEHPCHKPDPHSAGSSSPWHLPGVVVGAMVVDASEVVRVEVVVVVTGAAGVVDAVTVAADSVVTDALVVADTAALVAMMVV